MCGPDFAGKGLSCKNEPAFTVSVDERDCDGLSLVLKES